MLHYIDSNQIRLCCTGSDCVSAALRKHIVPMFYPVSGTASLASTWSTGRSAWGLCANRMNIWKVGLCTCITSAVMFGCIIAHKEICLFTLQLSCAESYPGGPNVLKDRPTGNAAAIAVATPKPGKTSPDGSRDGGHMWGWSTLETTRDTVINPLFSTQGSRS